jgi:hypothetical protein
MLSTFRTSVFLVALAVAASRAAAQEPSLVTLNPTNPTRWDFATQVGWVGGNKSDIAPEWNSWYDTASIEMSGGYYWTRHLKVELDLATTAAAGVSVQERLLLSEGFPVFRPREYQFRSTSIGAGVTYQFFENAWFHPFVSTGVSAIHERERAGIAPPMTFFRDSQTRVILPASDTFERTTTSVRPFAAAGFKAYVTERAFIRSDMRVSASSDRAEFVVWRAGVGFDF